MNSMKKLIKPIAFFIILLFLISIGKQDSFIKIGDFLQANLYQGLRTVKITEDKYKIKDKNVSISVKMPEIHYDNREVERYINTYIRTNINKFINNQRQLGDISTDEEKYDVSINYHVAFENTDVINIVIYKNISQGKSNMKFEKESYVFDLKTGQRIYLDNFLKDNDDYQAVIKEYIEKYIVKNKLNIDKSKIIINKYTHYIITDGGMNIYFNPYKQSGDNINYEFKIPYNVFKNKIRIIETNDIVANVDTQTITENSKYINSIINIPIIITQNKDIEKSINDKIRNDIMDFYHNSQKEAEDYFHSDPESQNKFVINADFEVKKNSDHMLSIMVEYYKYSGGAHGYYEDISYNIDMNNGENLKLQDLFKENIDYKSVIDREIRHQIEEIAKKDPQYEGIYEFNGIQDNPKFYIQDDNLVIYFDLYEIAPYPAGIPEFPINIKIINHILKDKYLEIFK